MRGPRLRAPLILGTRLCTSRSQKQQQQNAAAADYSEGARALSRRRRTDWPRSHVERPMKANPGPSMVAG